MACRFETFDAFCVARQLQESLLKAYCHLTAQSETFSAGYLIDADRELHVLASRLGYRVEKIAEPAAAAEAEAA